MVSDNSARFSALVRRVENGLEFKNRLKLLEMNLTTAENDEEASTILGDFLEASEDIMPPFVRRRVGKQISSIADAMEEESEVIPREIIDEVVSNMKEAIFRKEKEAREILMMAAIATSKI